MPDTTQEPTNDAKPVKTQHGLVSGRVQGVWYRAFVRNQAIKLSLTGWVKNNPDGQVELMMTGEEDALDKMHQALKKGSPLSRVDSVDLTEEPHQVFDSFEINH